MPPEPRKRSFDWAESSLARQPIAVRIKALRATYRQSLRKPDLLNWERVIFSFVKLCFDKHARPGAPKRWTPERWRVLLEDYETVHAAHPKDSIKRCCERLTREGPFRDRWGKLRPESLRRNLQYARKPNLLPPAAR